MSPGHRWPADGPRPRLTFTGRERLCVRWREPDDLAVAVCGFGMAGEILGQAELIKIAESLRPT
jgi:hypothetical protein